jgi:large subunit ribosomal protein L23
MSENIQNSAGNQATTNDELNNFAGENEKVESPPVSKQEFSLKNMIDLVKYPVLTEKTAVILSTNRQYTFDVDKSLTKTQIKKLFENLFQVNVISVNTHIPPRQTVRVGIARGYRPTYKRAIITLKENQTIAYNFKKYDFSKEG